MPRLIALIVTVVVAFALAGCGSSSKKSSSSSTTSTTSTSSQSTSATEYKTKVTAISSAFAAAGQAFQASITPNTTPQQAAAALEGFQTKVTKAADDLEALTPPDKVKPAHAALIKSFRAIADATQPSIDAGKAGDRAAFRTALLKLRDQLQGALGTSAKTAASQIDQGLAGQ